MLYVLKKIQNKTLGQKPGFYFIAKKKTFKKAVDRNKAKRIARHALKEALKNSPIPTASLFFNLERDIIQESFQVIVNKFKEDLK